MIKIAYIFFRIPILGKLLLFFYRTKITIPFIIKTTKNSIKWLFTSSETTNFTYNLEKTNERYLASQIADITNQNFDLIMGFIEELKKNTPFISSILNLTSVSSFKFMADKEVRFGRRIGWYAIIRVLKPKVVIETGVDKGLGACVITEALRLNTLEGFPGHYYGTDINLKAGYLLSGENKKYGTILYGDSIESLKKFDKKIDVFINDSDHSKEYENEEYNTIANKLSDQGIILGDNSHWSEKLLDFSLKTGRDFVFFSEKPNEHWYPGGGIGVSFKRNRKTTTSC